MNKRDFVNERKPSWDRFEEMLSRVGHLRAMRLSGNELSEYSRMMRELANDLALVKSRKWGEHLESYLNHLFSAGHNNFYRSPPGLWRNFTDFLSVTFPRLVRSYYGYMLVACLLFMGPFVITCMVIVDQPELASRILSEEQQESFSQMHSDQAQKSRSSRGGDTGFFSSGFYIQHNTTIGLQCFVSGFLFGVGTIYTLLSNGIIIGAVIGFLISDGLSDNIVSFVISHGSFELTAIVISGGAGLILGNSLVHRGQRTWKESLLHRGGDAAKIAGGAAVMFFIAALIEGFWSPSSVPQGIRIVVGIFLWVTVFLYFIFAGRERRGI